MIILNIKILSKIQIKFNLINLIKEVFKNKPIIKIICFKTKFKIKLKFLFQVVTEFSLKVSNISTL